MLICLKLLLVFLLARWLGVMAHWNVFIAVPKIATSLPVCLSTQLFQKTTWPRYGTLLNKEKHLAVLSVQISSGQMLCFLVNLSLLSFHDNCGKDLGDCTALIVIGTSLQVYPFASLVNMCSMLCPRLLINNETTGPWRGGEDNGETLYRDVKVIGDCDQGVLELADLMGLGAELREKISVWKTLFFFLLWEKQFRPQQKSHKSDNLCSKTTFTHKTVFVPFCYPTKKAKPNSHQDQKYLFWDTCKKKCENKYVSKQKQMFFPRATNPRKICSSFFLFPWTTFCVAFRVVGSRVFWKRKICTKKRIRPSDCLSPKLFIFHFSLFLNFLLSLKKPPFFFWFLFLFLWFETVFFCTTTRHEVPFDSCAYSLVFINGQHLWQGVKCFETTKGESLNFLFWLCWVLTVLFIFLNKQHHKSHLLALAKEGAKRFIHTRRHHLEEEGETAEEKAAREKREKAGPASDQANETPNEKEVEKLRLWTLKHPKLRKVEWWLIVMRILMMLRRKRSNRRKCTSSFLLVFVTICVLGVITFNIARVNHERFNEGETLTSAQFLGVDQFIPRLILVGMASGLVFGFIDNAGLFFGMEYLDPFLATLPMGDEQNVNAGSVFMFLNFFFCFWALQSILRVLFFSNRYGNTFSDMIGAFLGTFAGRIIEEKARENEEGGVLGWVFFRSLCFFLQTLGKQQYCPWSLSEITQSGLKLLVSQLVVCSELQFHEVSLIQKRRL